uniref:SUN domain-containing protein n=1 Tax=Strongyloides venezuelensis TaxID=75913 RepID=A0A0K0FV81_STRVS
MSFEVKLNSVRSFDNHLIFYTQKNLSKENFFNLEDCTPEINGFLHVEKKVNNDNNKTDIKKEYPLVIFTENPNSTIEIPLITTKSFANNSNLFLNEGNVSESIKCNWGEKCPEYYYHGCIFTGYVATFNLTPTYMFSSNNLLLNTSKYIHLNSNASNQTYTIPLYNSTSILFQTPNFITQGATKVYIVQTSYTKYIEKIVKWYNDNKWIEIEFIEWPILPNIYRLIDTQYNKYNQQFNPNLFTFRYEVISFYL